MFLLIVSLHFPEGFRNNISCSSSGYVKANFLQWSVCYCYFSNDFNGFRKEMNQKEQLVDDNSTEIAKLMSKYYLKMN